MLNKDHDQVRRIFKDATGSEAPCRDGSSGGVSTFPGPRRARDTIASRAPGGLPAARPGRDSDGAGLLDFFESLIGGASLRGRLDRKAPPPSEERRAPGSRSAAAFRDAVRAYKAGTVNQKQPSIGKRSSNAGARSRLCSIST